MINPKALLKRILKSLKSEGSFLQNYTIVLSGTGFTILIQLLISPLLTRIYGPEAYGIYSIFNALGMNLSLVSTLRYTQAFLLPKEEKTFKALLTLSVFLSVFFSLVLLVFFYFSGPFLLKWLNAEKLSPYSILLPLFVLFISLNQIVGQWQLRMNVFRKSVPLDTGLLIGVRGFNLLFGWWSNGMFLGLIIGDFLGKIVGLFLSFIVIIKQKIREIARGLTYNDIKNVAVEYKYYPIYSLPGSWIEVISAQLPLYFISSAFGLPIVGMMSLAISMMDLPKRLFSYSMSSVFFQHASQIGKENKVKLRKTVSNVIYSLLLLSVFPYSIVGVFGKELFVFVFGAEWITSGLFAAYFSFYFVFEICYGAISTLYNVLRMEKIQFYFQSLNIVTRALSLTVGIYHFQDLEITLLLLSIVSAAFFLIQILFIYSQLEGNWIGLGLKMTTIVCAVYAIVILIYNSL